MSRFNKVRGWPFTGRVGQRIPGTGWDCPAEYVEIPEDVYAKAHRAVFESKVGDDAYEVMGYGRPAETAITKWLAAMLKDQSAFPNLERLAEGPALIRAWRDELLDNLDRDEVEAMAESMTEAD